MSDILEQDDEDQDMSEIDEREIQSVYDLRDAEMFQTYLCFGSIGPAIWHGIGMKQPEGWRIDWFNPPEGTCHSLEWHLERCGNGQSEPDLFAFSPITPAEGLRDKPKRMQIMADLRSQGIIDNDNVWVQEKSAG